MPTSQVFISFAGGAIRVRFLVPIERVERTFLSVTFLLNSIDSY